MNPDREELGYHSSSMLTGEADGWCFGAELGRASRRSVWIFTDRRSAQGLGWAYLTSLSRRIAPGRTTSSQRAAGLAQVGGVD